MRSLRVRPWIQQNLQYQTGAVVSFTLTLFRQPLDSFCKDCSIVEIGALKTVLAVRWSATFNGVVMLMTDNLLIIANAPVARDLQQFLDSETWHVTVATTLAEANRLLSNDEFRSSVLVAESSRGEDDVLDMLTATRSGADQPGEWLILASDKDAAEAASRNGAAGVIEQPYQQDQIELILRRAAQRVRLRRRLEDQQREAARRYSPAAFVGDSAAAAATREALARIAAATPPAVLVRGEVGSGKRLAARIIHYSGARSAAPLVEVTCAAVPPELLEAELFGTSDDEGGERGALARAQGGTLLFDEVTALPASVQSRLSALLERSSRSKGVAAIDVQIIAATQRDLELVAGAGRCHAGLYRHLNAVPLRLRILRERPEDLEKMVWAGIAEFNSRLCRSVRQVPDDVWQTLRSHAWPGNVRELHNVLERGVLLSQGAALEQRWLPLPVKNGEEALSTSGNGEICIKIDGSIRLDEMERRLLEEGLKRRNGNGTQAARLLGVSRQTLRYRIEKHQLRPERGMPPSDE